MSAFNLGKPVRTGLHLVLTAVLVLGVQLVGTQALQIGQAVAQDEEKPPEKTRKTKAISAKVFEKLQKAQEAAEAKQWNKAISILDSAKAGDKLKGYDAASVWNVYGYIYYSREQYKSAIGAYKKVVNTPDIPEALLVGTQYTLAQLYFLIEDYPSAIRELKKWFKVAPNPGPDAYVMLAQLQYQQKDYNNALRSVEQGMSVARKREISPKEHWYLLLRVLYYEKNDYKNTARALESLTTRWPKREYWVQLAGMYGELKQDRKQLTTMETAYVQGMLNSEGELLNMAYLFLGNDMPYKAGKLLETAFKEKKVKGTAKNYELLGNAWQHSRETDKAIPALEQAAKLSDRGEIYARLANVYHDADKNGKCVTAANRAINKGGVKRKDNVYITKGMCQFNSEKLVAAKKSFGSARKFKASEKSATQWMGYLDREIERRAAVKKSLEDLKKAQEAREQAAAARAA